MNFNPNLVIQTGQNHNTQAKGSISISDLTKPVGQPFAQECSSPLKIKTGQLHDWQNQNSNIKMSEPSSISLIKPRQLGAGAGAGGGNTQNNTAFRTFQVKKLALQPILIGNDETPASVNPHPHSALLRGLTQK